MTKQELIEQRKALVAEIDNADEKRLAEIETALKRNALKMAELESDENRGKADVEKAAKDAEARAARPDPTATPENTDAPNGKNKVVLFNTADEKRENYAHIALGLTAVK